MRYSDSSAAYRYNSLGFQCLLVTFDNRGHQDNALRCSRVRQTNQPRVSDATQIYQLAKIGVDCDQYSIVRSREFQQCCVSRVWAKESGLNDIVSGIAQPLRETATCTPIDKKSHRPSTEIASSESLAMTAWA